MQQDKPTSIVNSLSSHASLLLSDSPTIINSPLHTNINNTSSFLNDDLPEDNINFKKPQNEIFKKLDGKIQKIVAAHSNLNKLYALNDFSGALGPKKPFELPPQLPRPPPWVPKVSSDCGCSQWTESSINSLNCATSELEHPLRHTSGLLGLNKVTKITSRHDSEYDPSASKPPTVKIDSAISKLHQRRQQQQQQRQWCHHQQQQIYNQNTHETIHAEAHAARQLFPSSSHPRDLAKVDFSKKPLLIDPLLNLQKQKESGFSVSPNLTDEERRKFQIQLINLFREEIATVTKLAKLKFSPQNDGRPQIVDEKSLLLKKSPQSLFNTIRRETSILLNRGNPINRSSSSLLVEQQPQNQANFDENLGTTFTQPFNKYQTIKVVVPPTEYYKHTCVKPGSKEGSENSNCNCTESKAEVLDVDQWCPPRKFTLKYRSLQLKLYRLKACMSLTRNGIYNPSRGLKRSSLKSLDKIVDRLQAKCLSSINSTTIIQETNKLLQGASPSPGLSHASQTSRETTPSPPSSPKPIPVFRTSPAKGAYFYGSTNSTGASKIVNLKSKKAKRLHHFGLKLGNYLEKECPQPGADKLTVEQFAKCLNLVRSNDASLQRQQEKLMQSELKWRMPVGDRPLRLRRIRGERIRMPASASYKATRKVGLQ